MSPFNPIRSSVQSTASSQQRNATTPAAKAADSWFERPRRSSVQSYQPKKLSKGKERSFDSVTSSDADPLSSQYNISSSFTSYESSLPRSPPSVSPIKKSRNSILTAASDAFGFNFGRKHKPSVKQPPQVLFIPGVIEITGPLHDNEGEERERLRDAAAQSIGIDPELIQGSQTQRGEEDIPEDDDFISVDDGFHPSFDEALDNTTTQDFDANTSIFSYGHPYGPVVRTSTRSFTHSRSNSVVTTNIPAIPPFPATLSAIKPLCQLSLTLPKFYPPTSLLVFALSKQWKTRFMIFSAPVVAGQQTGVSYLHLFKTSGPEEKEIERLEINENSVIFVAEEQVAGCGDVIKIGGTDVGAMKKELNQEDGGRTLWFLQIPGVNDSQKWMAMIKSAILSQRSMRAGLGVQTHAGGIEPRGDLDVMLSMRLQGISPSLQSIPDSSNLGHGPVSSSSRPTSSHRSSRSPTIASKSSGHTVSTLKGMFTSRPRSSSRATSIDHDRDSKTDDSFGAMGSNLLTMLRTNGTGDISMTPSHPTATTSTIPTTWTSIKKIIDATPSLTAVDHRLNLRITEHQAPKGTEGSLRGLPPGSLSLQPPPRKKQWHDIPSIVTTPSQDVVGLQLYQHGEGNRSVAGNFGIKLSDKHHSSPASPALTVYPSIAGQRERAASLRSDSTQAFTDVGGSTSSVKRLSKRADIPKQPTPPNGPPPSIPIPRSPQNSENRPYSWLKGHPYAAESFSSGHSSQNSGLSPTQSVSSSSTFWKRASASSVYSDNVTSSSNLRTPRATSAKRLSMPPPRPAPTFAPPPAPTQEPSPSRRDTDLSPKSFRNSVAQRALKLTSPKPPPSSELPPRPDEPAYKTHRRSLSSGTNGNLHSIPGSPTVNPLTSPFPPPSQPPSATTPTWSTNINIKQRLRNLSAPSPTSPSPTPGDYARSPPLLSMMIEAYSPPSTPIGERITTMQNDPSFLQLVTPVTLNPPKLPQRNPNRPSVFDYHSNSLPEIRSLSPPPRRGSKQLCEMVLDKTEQPAPQSSRIQDESKLATLSQGGSVVSLGFVTM